MPGRCARKRIREFRTFLDLNQKDFGKLFGVHQTTVCWWETHERLVIPVRVAKKLIRHAQYVGFDLTFEQIYDDSDEC